MVAPSLADMEDPGDQEFLQTLQGSGDLEEPQPSVRSAELRSITTRNYVDAALYVYGSDMLSSDLGLRDTEDSLIAAIDGDEEAEDMQMPEEAQMAETGAEYADGEDMTTSTYVAPEQEAEGEDVGIEEYYSIPEPGIRAKSRGSQYEVERKPHVDGKKQPLRRWISKTRRARASEKRKLELSN